MKEYLYHHWADSTLFIALGMIVVLLPLSPNIPLYLLLIWLQFPVYLVHEFEEHVYPGKFKEYINKNVFHSPVADFPLSAANVFWINILAIWILFPLSAILATLISPQFGVLLPIFGLFNATLHIIFLFIKRCYNPGSFVSIFLNYPTGIYTLYVLAQNNIITLLNLTSVIMVTIAAHALIIGIVFTKKRQQVAH
jgi:hypothetical protein